MPRARKRSVSASRKGPRAAVDKKKKILAEKYKDLFNSIDTDGSGTIEPTELTYALSDLHLTPHQIDMMIKEADTDENGRLDLDEFSKIMEASKGADDAWGKASKTLWDKIFLKAKRSAEVVEDACQPLHELSQRHSMAIVLPTGTNAREPDVTLRVIAHVLGPIILGFIILSCASVFILPALSLAHNSMNSIDRYYFYGRLKANPVDTIVWLSMAEGRPSTMSVFLLACFIGGSAALISTLYPASRGQTPGHYIFGMQMVNARTGERCGFFMILLRTILWAVMIIITRGIYEIIDGIFLISSGRTLTDQVLGVRVVIRV